MAADFAATERLYFDDTYLLEAPASWVGVVEEGGGEESAAGRLGLVLDKTVFHPTGGGQPSDVGTITTPLGAFVVSEAVARGDVIVHFGAFEGDEGGARGAELPKDVSLSVDGSARTLHARIHSGGHLLDKCMEAAGQGHLEPGKGHHGVEGPYVEYKGKISAAEQEAVKAALEEHAARLIAEGGVVTASVASYDEAAALCGGSLPPYIPADARPRIVVMAGVGCPCGGTHVGDVAAIESLKITGIRVRKQITRISYTVPGAIAAAGK